MIDESIRSHSRSHVVAHLGGANTLRRGPVEVVDDQPVDRLGQTSLVVIPDRYDEYDEGVLVGGLEAYPRPGPEEEGAKVERPARAVRGDVRDVILDDVVAGLDKHVDGYLGHHHALGAPTYAVEGGRVGM